MSNEMRYRIEQDPEGGWIIVHGADPGLCWCGTSWVDREQFHPLTFPDKAAARKHAAEVWGE